MARHVFIGGGSSVNLTTRSILNGDEFYHFEYFLVFFLKWFGFEIFLRLSRSSPQIFGHISTDMLTAWQLLSSFIKLLYFLFMFLGDAMDDRTCWLDDKASFKIATSLTEASLKLFLNGVLSNMFLSGLYIAVDDMNWQGPRGPTCWFPFKLPGEKMHYYGC